MSRILALDTTGHFGSVALLEENTLLEEVLMHEPDGFAQVLFDRIAGLLLRHGLRPADVNCYASATGPGSFTGVRVGLTAAKGLAEANGRLLVGVSNLRALAALGTAPLRAPLLDARRGEVYAAVYDDALEAVQPETVGKFPDWLQQLPAGEIEFISPDLSPFLPALQLRQSAPPRVTEGHRALAAAIGRIAWREFQAGRAQDPAAVDANYVRRSDAELLWKDR